MSTNQSAPSNPRHTAKSFWRGLAIAGMVLMAIVLIAGVAVLMKMMPSPGQEEAGDTPVADAGIPCFYSLQGIAYPPPGEGIEPTQYALIVPPDPQHDPIPGGYPTLDPVGNATAYAIWPATATAYAAVCPDISSADVRATYDASGLGSYPPPNTQAPYPMAPPVSTVDPLATDTPTPTITSTNTPSETMTASQPPSATPQPQAPDRPGDPASAGLTYVADGYLWRIEADGQPVALEPIRTGTGELDPTRALGVSSFGGDLVIMDVATGEQHNLTDTTDRQEEEMAWWPARPGTLVYIYWGPATPDDPTSPTARLLGSINLDGSDQRTIGLVGDLGVRNYALGSDGDTLFYVEGRSWVRYRFSDGSRQEYRQEDLGLEQLCTSLQGPGLSPDGRWLATRCFFEHEDRTFDGAVVLVDLENGTGRILDRRSIDTPGYLPTAPQARWSPDLRYVLTPEETSSALYMRVNRVDDGQLVARLPESPELFSPDGQWLVMRDFATGRPSPWYLVDTATWTQVRPLAIHDGAYGVTWP